MILKSFKIFKKNPRIKERNNFLKPLLIKKRQFLTQMPLKCIVERILKNPLFLTSIKIAMWNP